MELIRQVRMRVFKKEPDERTMLFGEPVQTDEKGRDFFEVPAFPEFKKYVHDLLKHYEMGPDFIPSTAQVEATMESPADVPVPEVKDPEPAPATAKKPGRPKGRPKKKK